jgi:serine/threonine protein kinase
VNFLRNGEKYLLLKVKNKVDGFYYLLKHINFQILNEEEKENAFNESKILSILKHPNIIELKKEIFNNLENAFIIVMDFQNNVILNNKIQFAIKNKAYQEENTIFKY